MKPTIRAQSAPWRSAVQIYIGDADGKTHVTDMVIESTKEGTASPPCFTLDEQTAQTLMDDLWNCGLRPTEGAGSAGALMATQRHLEDMRTLVFKPNRSEQPKAQA